MTHDFHRVQRFPNVMYVAIIFVVRADLGLQIKKVDGNTLKQFQQGRMWTTDWGSIMLNINVQFVGRVLKWSYHND